MSEHEKKEMNKLLKSTINIRSLMMDDKWDALLNFNDLSLPKSIKTLKINCGAYSTDIIKKWISKFRKPKVAKSEPGFVLKIWEKYGVIGLGLLGTMTVGAPISIGVGVGFNVPTNKMVFWCCLGVLIRCALFTTIGHFSLKLF